MASIDKFFGPVPAIDSWRPEGWKKWVAFAIMGILALPLGYTSLFMLFLSVMYPPGLLIAMAPGSVLTYLFVKKRYASFIIVEIVLVLLLAIHSRDFLLNELAVMPWKLGIPIADDVIPGILNLPDVAIPKSYSLEKKGHIVEYDFSPTKYYTKDYSSGIISNYNTIGFSYAEKECDAFYLAESKNMEVATCKAGPCILNKGYPSEFQINDNGACAKVSFTALDDNSLTREEIQAVVDSLERVPGERPHRSFEEMATPAMKFLNSMLEDRKKREGIYDMKGRMNMPLTLTEGDCISTLNIDIASDEQSYVIHRPLCPNNKMSYCIGNGQTEIKQVPTETVEKTHRCQ